MRIAVLVKKLLMQIVFEIWNGEWYDKSVTEIDWIQFLKVNREKGWLAAVEEELALDDEHDFQSG